jgi:hypothetical protein
MIVHFDLEEDRLAAIRKPLLQERVSSILRAHRSGAHLVIVSRQTGKWLAKNANKILLDADRSTLHRLLQEITQSGDLVRRAPKLLRIGAQDTILGITDDRIIELPIDYEQFERILERPALVIEDIVSDGKVYEAVFQALAKKKGFWPAFEAVHGGGNRAMTVALYKVREGRIVHVVLDSDKATPFSPDTKIARIQRLPKKHRNWPLLFFDVTPGRELENILTVEVLALAAKTDTAKATLKHIKEISQREAESEIAPQCRYWLYFDFKSGLKKQHITGRVNQKEKEWIESRLRLANLNRDLLPLAGLGKSLAVEVMQCVEWRNHFRRAILSNDWQSVYGEFVSKIVWTFAAPQQQRT